MAATDPIAGIPVLSDAARMSRLGAILYGLSAGAIVLLFARESIEPAIWLFQEYAGDTVAIAITGWLMATLGPMALSICIWLVVRRLKARWLWHLIFIPIAIVLARCGASLFFFGAKASGDGSPEGYALLMASALLSLSLIVHTAAFVEEGFRTITHRANGS